MRFVIGTAMALLLGSVACDDASSSERAPDSGTEGTDAAFPLIEAEDFPRAFHEARAAFVARCCEQAGLTADAFAASQGQLRLPDAASGARSDRDKASACVAETRNAPCAVKGTPKPELSSCREAWTSGKRNLGEPCTSAWECAPSETAGSITGCSASLTRDGWMAGECFEQRVLRAGDACDDTLAASCPYPLLCDPAEKRCVEPAALGDACVTGGSFGDTCEPGALCDRKGTERCIEPKPVGASCASIEECENHACVDGRCREPFDVITLCDR